MLRYRDRTHSWSAAAVGDAESFVQVEVADVGADGGGTGQADLGIHVGAVHVDLAAVLVNELTDFPDVFFEDAVGAGVGNHEAGEILFMLARFALEVIEVDVSAVVA